ncbi:MAG: hypothetical protein AAF391_06965, partial [Bacteroidota bacterium]
TTPEVGNFLRTHVGGTEPLPFSEVLGWAGINYAGKSDKMVITAGKFTPAVNEEGEIYVAGVDDLNDFGKDLGLEEGDILVAWNESPITLEEFSNIIQKFYDETEAGDKVSVTVKREVKGKTKEKKLKAKARTVKSSQKHELTVDDNPTEEQLKVRSIWLEPK